MDYIGCNIKISNKKEKRKMKECSRGLAPEPTVFSGKNPWISVSWSH